MSLFTAVTSDEMQGARIVTGVTMVLLLAVGRIPGTQRHAGSMRLALVLLYLLACGIFIAYVLLR